MSPSPPRLSSVAVAPEIEACDQATVSTSSHSVKRRHAADDESRDGQEEIASKRRKVSPEPASDPVASPPSPNAQREDAESKSTDDKKAHRPPRERGTRQSKPIDERTRSRRLFGGLLSAGAPTKRVRGSDKNDLEARKKQELQKRQAVLEERAAARLNALLKTRNDLQDRLEDAAHSVRHAHMRCYANSLITTAEPQVYYRPWELMPEEEVRIKRRQEETEVAITREQETLRLHQRKRKEEKTKLNGHVASLPSTADPEPGKSDIVEPAATLQDDLAGSASNGPSTAELSEPPPTEADSTSPAGNGDDIGPDTVHKEERLKLEHEQQRQQQQQDAMMDAGDVHEGNDAPVDAGEDTVMY